MKNTTNFIMTILACILFLVACGGNSQEATTSTATASGQEKANEAIPEQEDKMTTPTTPVENKELAEQELVFAWVDNLNLREEPKTSSKIVMTISEKDPLIYSGEKTDFTEEITLRGKVYDEPWIKVITADKKKGWVFRGAVKRKGEKKGNALVGPNSIDFPHFGSFNLENWAETSSKDESGGDAEGVVKTYSSGEQILEIRKTEVGEYGYYRTHTLMDKDKEILKVRELGFSVDPEYILTEEVFDFTQAPAKKYIRTQKFKQHFLNLKPRPESASGSFQELALTAEELKRYKQ